VFIASIYSVVTDILGSAMSRADHLEMCFIRTVFQSSVFSFCHKDSSRRHRNTAFVTVFVDSVSGIMSKSGMMNWQYVNHLRDTLA
jgi:hypothetical protein